MAEVRYIPDNNNGDYGSSFTNQLLGETSRLVMLNLSRFIGKEKLMLFIFFFNVEVWRLPFSPTKRKTLRSTTLNKYATPN